jgi:hypothetical protein
MCGIFFYTKRQPQTKEDMLYREIFDSYGYEGVQFLISGYPIGTTLADQTTFRVKIWTCLFEAAMKELTSDDE